MSHEGYFSESFTSDPQDVFSVSYYISDMQKYQWGTWYNICHSLGLHDQENILLSGVGDDFVATEEYRDRTNLDYLIQTKEKSTASGFIVTDQWGNQATAFYPGAMDDALQIDVSNIQEDLSYAIISPNGAVMLPHLRACVGRWWKTFFDPGQGTGFLTAQELTEGVELANYLIVNAYEYELLQERTWLTEEDILWHVEKLIVTQGKDGVDLIDQNWNMHIDAIAWVEEAHPTGAGDAFRGWLLAGLSSDENWQTAAKIWCVTAAFCVESMWPATHTFTKEEFEHRLEMTYSNRS